MTNDLGHFIELVASRPDLRRVLAEEKSADTFAQQCAHLGEQHHLTFTAAEVNSLLLERAITWHQRHTL